MVELLIHQVLSTVRGCSWVHDWIASWWYRLLVLTRLLHTLAYLHGHLCLPETWDVPLRLVWLLFGHDYFDVVHSRGHFVWPEHPQSLLLMLGVIMFNLMNNRVQPSLLPRRCLWGISLSRCLLLQRLFEIFKFDLLRKSLRIKTLRQRSMSLNLLKSKRSIHKVVIVRELGFQRFWAYVLSFGVGRAHHRKICHSISWSWIL